MTKILSKNRPNLTPQLSPLQVFFIFELGFPCSMVLLLSLFAFAFIDFDLRMPVDTFTDMIMGALGYGLICVSTVYILLYVSIKHAYPFLIPTFQHWLSQGKDLLAWLPRTRTGAYPFSIRLLCYIWITLGVTLALGILPLMINQYFAHTRPVCFHAVVIEKKCITEWKPRHGSSKQPHLKVRTDDGQEFDLSFLHQKLNLQDHVNIQVRQGWLGIRFYSAVYKDVKNQQIPIY